MGSPFEAAYDSDELYAILDDNQSRCVKRRNRPGFGQRVKGILDPMADRSTFRAFVWLRDARAQAGTEDIQAFAYEGATYFMWRGNRDNTAYTEAIHFEDIGLVREFR